MKWTQQYKWGITILIFAFLGLNAWLLTMAFSLDISLVDEDYYQKDLAYQQTIDELQRTASLDQAVYATYEDGKIIIHFPVAWVGNLQSGNVHLYRPSDANLDRQVPLSPNAAGRQVIPADQLLAGRWVVKVRWLMNEKWYRAETSLVL